jgi:predicted amidohydrolase
VLRFCPPEIGVLCGEAEARQRPQKDGPATIEGEEGARGQAGAYQNATWVVGVAKCGREEGCDLIGQSAIIIAPSGEIVAQAATLGDELVTARCDLDSTIFGKETIFDFARHRRIEHYGLITSQTGVVRPPEA